MKLDQYFTPVYAAERIISRFYPDLGNKDLVVEPSCGDGRFLSAIPQHITAIGVEIDAEIAAQARENTGRHIITGDFRFVELPFRPTLIIGNPPFQVSLIEEFMKRCYEVMDYGGRVGFILPTYVCQTATTFLRMTSGWSVDQTMIPRNIFKGLETPIMFARFSKDRSVSSPGFFLYVEVDALRSLKEKFRARFYGNSTRYNLWKETVYAALEMNGGKATLQQLYKTIESNRPTENKFWREKIRQTLYRYFARISETEFGIP